MNNPFCIKRRDTTRSKYGKCVECFGLRVTECSVRGKFLHYEYTDIASGFLTEQCIFFEDGAYEPSIRFNVFIRKNDAYLHYKKSGFLPFKIEINDIIETTIKI